MSHLFQPIASLFVGLCMFVYGLIHSIARFPGSDTFAAIASKPARRRLGVHLLPGPAGHHRRRDAGRSGCEECPSSLAQVRPDRTACRNAVTLQR